ncbi:MAG: hypothetical protein Q4D32_09830 [Eubacteriales bacterium]|nr:hypothetical protein [Eubacteriales bacterium]
MKKKIGLMAIITYLCLVILIQIIYHVEIQMWISDDWLIADRFVNCFCLINYFLVVYLLLDRKYYYELVQQQEKDKVRLWMGLNILCQIGMIFVYFILWIGYTDRIREPLDIPIRCVYNFLSNSSIYVNVPTWEIDYWDGIILLIILSPIVLSFLIYIIHFFVRYIQLKQESCLSRIWKWWNYIYIICVILLISWVYDVQQVYDTIIHIPIHYVLPKWLLP